MKYRILTLGLCLCMVLSLLPAGILAAGTDESSAEDCRTMTREWFAGNPSTELILPAEQVSRKSARSLAGRLDDYFNAREDCWTGHGAVPRKAAQSVIGDSAFAAAVAAFEERAELRITDAQVTTVYDNSHIIAGDNGSYTLFVYEWVFFDYDDLSDAAAETDVSGCGFSHKIVLSPSAGGYEITSDEYDASELLGICTLNDSTERELEEMNWTPAETGAPDDIPAEDPVFGPAKKSVFYSRYSPEACTAYADRYVYNKAQGGTVYESYYNSAYANYNSVGGDCANYTSQCISAGGMPQVKGTHTGTDGWYYNSRNDRSGTWTYVPYLRDWMAANRGVKRAASDSTVWKGSPVFYGDQHAVICVGWNTAGVPVINSHNKDWYHVKWNYFDPGNVTTVQLTPSPDPSPQPGMPVLDDFDRSVQSGQSVVFTWEDTYTVTHYNLYLDARRADGTWDRNRQVRNYAQSGETMRLPDGVYRVMLQAVNAQDEDWPYTNGDPITFVVGSHTHSRGELAGFEAKHPHPARYRCAECGEVWTDRGTSSESESCSVCQMPGKPVLQGPQETCAAFEPVSFTWEPVEKATRYSLYIEDVGEDGTLQAEDTVLECSGTGCTVRLDAGSYRARLRAENTRCAMEDGSGWAGSESDAVSFTVARKVNITFDPAGGSFGGAVCSERADRLDAGWILDELSVFTADGEPVNTGAGAVEAAVDADGLVTEKRVPGVTEEHLTVPYGGFVIAAGGDGVFPKTAFVNAIEPGDFVAFDREQMTVYQYADADAYLARHKSVLPSEAYGCLPVPEKEGCLFAGWLDESGQPAGCGTAFSSAKLSASWAVADKPPSDSIRTGGHRYERYEYRMSWQEAERFCEEHGGHLAVITSFEEQAAVESLARGGSCAGYFIGCSLPDGQTEWSWISGEDISAYGNWETGSPDPSDGRCFAAMAGSFSCQEILEGRWVCVPDLPAYPADSLCCCGFICEYDTASAESHEHEFTETVSPASCTAEGYILRRCACGEAEISVIPADGHDYTKEVTAPGCTQQGFTAYTCARCGDSYTANPTDALGHDYDVGVCIRCGAADPGYVPEPDPEELNTVIAGAFRINLDGFTFDSIDALDAALERAAAAAENGTQKEMDSAAEAVRAAVDALVPVPARIFRDVRDSDRYYYDAVYWAFCSNPRITNGFDGTDFAPDRPCTRAQVVTFLWRAARCPAPRSTSTSFLDVKSGAFYEKAVAWAVENGITKGVSKTKFDPNAPCTRAQIVTFLWRFMGSVKAEGTASFPDLKPGAYYTGAVAWAVENGVTRGMSTETFEPDGGCTRGQAVTFLYRAEKGK